MASKEDLSGPRIADLDPRDLVLEFGRLSLKSSLGLVFDSKFQFETLKLGFDEILDMTKIF